MVKVQAKNGDTWGLDEECLPMLFEAFPLVIPVNKEAFDQLVVYAKERQSMMNQGVGSSDGGPLWAGSVEEERFNEEFITRYKDYSLQQVAPIASGARKLMMTGLYKVMYENQLRRLMEAGTPQDQARADLDMVM